MGFDKNSKLSDDELMQVDGGMDRGRGIGIISDREEILNKDGKDKNSGLKAAARGIVRNMAAGTTAGSTGSLSADVVKVVSGGNYSRPV